MNAITTINPVYDEISSLIDSNPDLAVLTKMQYKKAVRNYLFDRVPGPDGKSTYVLSGRQLSDVDTLTAYASELKKSSRSFLKAAVRMWGKGIELKAKSGATPENIAAVQATVFRVEALNESIRVGKSDGQKTHTWLSRAEVKQLFDTCDVRTPRGLRDKIVLGLMVAAGLRRAELCALRFDDVIKIPVKDKIRTSLKVKGKGGKDREIPISDKLAERLDQWHKMCGDGKIARSVNRGGRVNGSLSESGCFKVCNDAGKEIGKPELAPHDLRRTYAQLGFEAGVPITQISKLLGHASVATTQRYLNLDLDRESTISDFIPFD